MKFFRAIEKLQKINTNNIVVETVPEDVAQVPVAIEAPSAKEDEKQTRYSHVMSDPRELLCAGFSKLNGSRHLSDTLTRISEMR